ncbi:MAG: peptidoglycan DD-metalloendopeptidase family protein, partial [Saprospiraceae bacterium]
MTLSEILKKSVSVIAFLALLLINGFLLKFILSSETNFLPKSASNECNIKPVQRLGFDLSLFNFQEQKFKNGQLFPELLFDLGINRNKISKILKNLEGIIDMRSIRSGNKYYLVSTNECTHPDFLLYELAPSKVIVCDLSGTSSPGIINKKMEIKRESAFGHIKNSLWQALEESGVSLNIIDQMEDALATSVDFLHVQSGSSFKLIFDRTWIDGQPSTEGTLLAAYFNTGSNEHHAFRFDVNGKFDYYDINGRPLRRSFLQAPVRFSRISSGFSLNRFHPVLKYSRPHFGTDYAAPVGTPIMSVGNGVVIAASYTIGNGNFVKIRHNEIYVTQYLHMSKFASGIKPGRAVNQGQIIGYVGKTGLATGPHVCFRFWKNDVQVDHRKLKFPSGEPLPHNLMDKFISYRDSLIDQINTIQGSAAMLRPTKDPNK